ncbi:MAG: capsular biosynthesis protein [Bacteroidales bacterium]|nr:capsular biosynthesis protein [Bacteroidales bacterium]MCM1146834.1 capsular biosynthesis protein [Bacteroidales bacterium]MCM1205668.1 capsular biosynthesis protein [Bacillota bacterium]MCM1510220.1 hypothetical protein [Clostridium sp.]
MLFFKSTIRISDTSILNGFTDCHCHLLPGVDDGVKRMEDTLKLLDMMQRRGVREVWLTPHIMEEYPNNPEDLRRHFGSIPYDGPMKLCLAAEHMLDSEFSIGRSSMLTLPDNQLLVETSYFTPPLNLKDTFSDIKAAGLNPVLAHPCRYQYMEYENYEELHSLGIRFQLNVPALAGLYGPAAKNNAEWILDHGYYSLAGSDIHSITHFRHFLDSKISRKVLKKVRVLIGNE